MGRRANWPPKVIPHKASGRDRCQFRGRTYYLGPIGSAESRAAYVELIRRLQAGAADGSGPDAATEPPPPGEGTVRHLVAMFHVHAAAEYGAASDELTSYRQALNVVLSLYGGERVAAFDCRALRAVQAEMARRWCRNRVNRSVVRVRTAWRWAEMERIAPPGSWAALRAVPPLTRPRPGLRESPKVQPVEEWVAMRAAFLGAAPGLRLLVLLGWWTGARPSELTKLTPSMIDTSGPVWRADLTEHKCAWRGHSRTLFFGPECQGLLGPALEGVAPDAPLCPNGTGGFFNRRSLYLALRRACDRAGVARFFPYRLRHAFRRRIARLLGPEAARTLLGQRSMSVLEGYAVGIDAILAEESARKAG